MEGLSQYIDAFTGFVESAHWILPALGLLFIFLCIVSKGFRNFILGLIILAVLIFEGFWFYGHFYSTDEERAEFKKKVEQVFDLKKEEGIKKEEEIPLPTPRPMLTPTQTPLRYFLKNRKR